MELKKIVIFAVLFLVLILVLLFSLLNLSSNKIDSNIKQLSKNYKDKIKYKKLIKKKYNFLLEDYKDTEVPKNKIEESFLELLNLLDSQIKTEIEENKIVFNTKNHEEIKLKYRLIENKNDIKIIKKDFNEYILFLEDFLKNYKNGIQKKDYIKNYIRKNLPYDFNNSQSNFKSYLVFLWTLGRSVVNNNYESEEILLFYKEFDKLYEVLKNENGYYKNYDWFLFTSHYPIILIFKLFFDFKIKKITNFVYIQEIFKYLPKLNYSKRNIRNDSNVSIIGIGYITAHLFEYQNEIEKFYDFLTNIKNSDVYQNEITLCYRLPENGKFIQGLYFDGGFIVHKNLANYNYLLAYFHSSFFYKGFFTSRQDNVEKINMALQKIQFKKRVINPSIVSRFGKFFEIQNEWLSTTEIQLKNKLGITIIESTKILIANYQNWSIQIKINSDLGYAEIDTINNCFFKQILFSKIIITDEFSESSLRNDSYYPGILTYKNFLERSETIPISYGTKVLTFSKVNSLFKKLDNDKAVIFSRVKVKELKIEYEEFIFICEKGIVVGYFNIKAGRNEDLLLVFHTPILSEKINSEIIYTDSNTKSFAQKNSKLQLVNKNVLYTQYFEKMVVGYINNKIIIDNWQFEIFDNSLFFLEK